MQKRLITVGVLFLTFPLHIWCIGGASRNYEKWNMKDSFSNGIPSWQSYPLAQDIGYDPSIYTTSLKGNPVLVRDVINEGQKTQAVGMIRPLKFRLTASTRIAVAYSLHLAGKPIAPKIILAASNGARYEAPLPVNSDPSRPYMITGTMLEASGREANIVAVVILSSTQGAPLGSHSLLTLYSFAVRAMRPATLAVVLPRLVESSSETVPVAEDFVTAGQPARFSLGGVPSSVVVKDGSGATVDANITIDGPEVRWTPAKSADPGLWTIEAKNDRASVRFQVLVLPDSTGAGILLSANRIASLRTDSRYAELRQVIHKEAAQLAGEVAFNLRAGDSIALLPKKSALAGLPAYLALMDSYGGLIVYGALDYRLNGDRQSLANVRRALATVAAWKTWTPSWFTAHGIHTYYIVGVFTEKAAVGYDLVSSELSPEERTNVERAFMSRSIQPTIDDYFLKQRMPTAASNHMAHSVGGAIAAWAACDRADPQWRVQNGTSLAELLAAYQGLLEGLFPGDGSEREPPGYEVFAMEGMTYGISALKSLGITPEGTLRMMESFWWLRYAEVNPRLVLGMGDTSYSLPGLSGYAWVAEHSKDPGARWFYDTVGLPSMDFANMRSKRNNASPTLIASLRVPSALDLLCCTQPAASAPMPPASRIFPLRGTAVFRQGWGENQTVISLRAGAWMNHEHHDQGSFQLASRGDLLVGEAGYADYYHDPNYKDYFSEAPGHNVVLLDNDPFSQVPYDGDYFKAFSNHPRIISSLLSDQVDYLEANLQPAYGKALTKYNRTFLFIKPDLLIVSDDIHARISHTYQWLLHTAPGAALVRQDLGMTVEGKDKRAMLTAVASDPASYWRISPAPIAIKDFKNLDRVPVDERYILSLESKPSLNAKFLVGLSVTQSGEASTIERCSTESGRGFLQNGVGQRTVVLFRKNSGALETSGVTTDGDVLVVTQSDSDGELHVFARHAGFIRMAGVPGLFWTSPENVVVDRTQREVVLNLKLDKPSTLKFKGQIEQGSLSQDGTHDTDFTEERGLPLSSGKHRISFTLTMQTQ